MYKPSTSVAVNEAAKPLAVLNRIDVSNSLKMNQFSVTRNGLHIEDFEHEGQLRNYPTNFLPQACVQVFLL